MKTSIVRVEWPIVQILTERAGLGRLTCRFGWSYCFSHRLEHPAQIAVGRDDRGRIFFKCGAHHVEAPKKRIKFLRIRRVECGGIDGSCLRVSLPFSFQGILRCGGTDRSNVAFFLAADIRRLAASFGAKSGSDLMSFARHEQFRVHRRADVDHHRFGSD